MGIQPQMAGFDTAAVQGTPYVAVGATDHTAQPPLRMDVRAQSHKHTADIPCGACTMACQAIRVITSNITGLIIARARCSALTLRTKALCPQPRAARARLRHCLARTTAASR